MSRIAVLCLVSAFLYVEGCAQTEQPANARASTATGQRFVTVPEYNRSDFPWPGAFALDTMTGQLCRTYPVKDAVKPGVETVPLCHDLWLQTNKNPQQQ